ncbi:MAG: ATPase [Pseudorhodobacter sp.]|nr:MAG: ATPase [Pseudorhodobacter sp.]
MPLFLGIDGGGTGCRAALADASGQILARAEAGPANIFSNRELALQNILAVAQDALVRATGSTDRLPALRAGLGLAGANASGASDWLAAHLPFAATRIETDAMTTTKGALGRNDGIVAALGTGSVFAIQQAGRVRQIGGWGFWLGDEGSGAVLGRTLFARALRALDGVHDMTPLLQSVLDHFQAPDRLVAFSLAAKPADYAAWAPRLFHSPDPAAKIILAKATDEVRATIAALQPDPALPVTFIGGLGPNFADLIPDWPQRPAQGTALDGALLLAMEGME